MLWDISSSAVSHTFSERVSHHAAGKKHQIGQRANASALRSTAQRSELSCSVTAMSAAKSISVEPNSSTGHSCKND
jgi:hypothetical protein